jgi:nickel-dependent lactate racemase
VVTSPRQAAVTIPWASWFGDREVELAFPSGWDVALVPPADGPDIGDAGIAHAFANPIGSPRIRDLARGKKTAVIVVDDLSRPTPAWRVLPTLLIELATGGIGPDDVLIVMGVANHRQLTREDMIKKLGQPIVNAVEVKNHFSWDNCDYVGTTSRGTPVRLNRDVLARDLRILVGGITPHGKPGFAGGAKLVLPGVAHIDTATAWHGTTGPAGGLAQVVTEARLDAEEAARLGGAHTIVNIIPNSRRGIAGLVVGDLVQAHRAGVAIAQRVFATTLPAQPADIGVLTAFPKDTEFLQIGLCFNIWATAPRPLVTEHGSVVLCTAASEGYGFHSLMGPGMRLHAASSPAALLAPRDVVVFAPGVQPRDLPAPMRAGLTLCQTWQQVITRLVAKHGAAARVAAFPCSAMQIAADAVPKL